MTEVKEKVVAVRNKRTTDTLNDLRDKVFAYAEKQGFHEDVNFGEQLMLAVSELGEAMEAYRKDKWAGNPAIGLEGRKLLKDPPESIHYLCYERYVRGTVEEEIVDTILRLLDIAGIYGIDLNWHIEAKRTYNKTRPYKHGKKC